MSEGKVGLGSALGYLNLTLDDDEEGGGDENGNGSGSVGMVARSSTTTGTSATAGLGPGLGLGLGQGSAPGQGPASGSGLSPVRSRVSRPPRGMDHSRSVLVGTVHQRLGHILLQVGTLSTLPHRYIHSPRHIIYYIYPLTSPYTCAAGSNSE